MTADLEPFRCAVVRVLSENGELLGLGLRLADGIVVTCAHVVGAALKHDARCEACPEGMVRLQAPVLAVDLGLAKPVGWFPKRDSKPADEPADLAVLRLDKASALSFAPPPISTGLSLAGIQFSLLGAPEGHTDHLVPIYGRIGQPTTNGRYLLYQEGPGYRIEPGCSGAPVCDDATGQIIGLVVQDEQDRSAGVAFLIAPRELLSALERAGLSTAARTASPLELVRCWIGDSVARHDPRLGRRLREFIDAYSRTAEQALPFVGRDNELGRLRAWLADGELFFVTGSVGRGKSALLVHFMSDVLAQQRDVTVLFLPISIRFETADELTGLRLLYVQLSALFAELRFAPSAHPDQSDYRERIESGWTFIGNQRNRRFLLVLDGADEASGGWVERDVLPYELPANFAIIVSVRSADESPATPRWLTDVRRHDGRDVACETAVLPLLSRDAVKDAVVQLGHPVDEIVEREAVMDELYRLTDQGDPLLVSLWVGQLWRSRDQRRWQTAAHLQRLAPGIGGFLDVWFEEQEQLWKFGGFEVSREEFEPLLYLFAVAQGPLTTPDLSSLAMLYHVPERWRDTYFVEQVLKCASRLLVRSAETGGFSFVHPRLAFHYRATLDQHPAALKRLRVTFIEWGRETVERLNRSDLSLEECPAYLRHHYVRHVQDAMTNRDLSLEQALDCHLLLLVLEPGWHRAWFEAEGAYGGFLGDLSRVEQALRSAGSVRHPGRELHCVLCRASIHSLASGIPPPLFAQLVDGGLWSVTRALKVSEHLAPRSQVEALLGVVAATAEDRLRNQLLAQALAAAQAIDNERERAEALVAVAEQLSGAPELLAQALVTAQAIYHKWERAQALTAVAGQLSGEARRNALEQALAAAQALDNEGKRAEALVAVAEQLSGAPELLAQALAAAQAIYHKWERARALAAVAGQLSGKARRNALEQALAAAQAIHDEWERARALAAVAGQLSGEARRNALEQALAAAQAIYDKWERARALVALAGQLSGKARRNALEQALAAAQAIKNEGYRAEVLVALAGQLSGAPELLAQALAAAQALDDEKERAEALVAVAGQLSGKARRNALEQALATAQAIDNEGYRAEALVAVAGQLSGKARRNALEQALATAQAIDNEGYRAEALVAVAGQLTGGAQRNALEQALVAAQAIDNEGKRAEALVALAGQLSGEARRNTLEQALAAAQAIYHKWERARALAAVAGQLSGEARRNTLGQALAAVQAIKDEGYRAEALVAVAGQLTGGAQRNALEQALVAAQAIDNEGERAEALVAVAEQLSGAPELLVQALAAAQTLDDERERAEALVAMAGQLSGAPELLAQALAAAQTLDDERERAEALVAMAGQLSGAPELLAQALAAAQAIKNEGYRAEALVAVAGQLSGAPELLAQALVTAQTLDDERERAWVLTAVVGQLSGEARRNTLEQALAAAQAIDNERERAEALVAVAEQLSGAPELLVQALAAAQALDWEQYRARALVTLAGQLSGEARRNTLEQALAAAQALDDERERAEALVAVAEQLSGAPELLVQALAAAQALDWEQYRARALVTLAGQLSGEARRNALEQALAAAQAIKNEGYRAEVLVALAGQLSGEARRNALEQALAAAQALDNEGERARALVAVAEQLSGAPELLAQALAATQAIYDKWERARALAAVVRQLSGEARRNALEQALAAAQAIKNEGYRAEVLVALAGQLSGEARRNALEQALAAAQAIHDKLGRAEALVAVAEQLSGAPELLVQALAAAQELGWEQDRAKMLVALAGLAGQLSGKARRNALEQVLAAAQAIHDEWGRARALAAVAGQLTGVGAPELAYTLFARVIDLMHEMGRPDALNLIPALSPVIGELGGELALRETAQAISKTATWWP